MKNLDIKSLKVGDKIWIHDFCALSDNIFELIKENNEKKVAMTVEVPINSGLVFASFDDVAYQRLAILTDVSIDGQQGNYISEINKITKRRK